MKLLSLTIDDVLRLGAKGDTGSKSSVLIKALVAIACSMFYGVVMASYSSLTTERSLHLAYVAIKMPMLLGVTFLIALPSFAVLNTLLGLRADLAEVLRGLLASQAVLAIVLAALAPYVAVWYASTSDYNGAILFNGVMFAVASLCGQFALRRYYRDLVVRDRRHRIMLRVWTGIFAFVGIQMAWVLRPFIGDPTAPVSFFREDVWDNAYMVVWGLIWRFFTG